MPADYFDRERKFLQAQVLEVRADLASIGQRQQDLRANDAIDSVEARNASEQLQAEREQALRELNRINEDLRKLALAEEARAKEERELKRLADVEAARQKEALEREERDKADRLREAIDRKDEFLREGIARKDELLREEIDRRERERTEAARTPPPPPTLDPGAHPGADTLAAGAVAVAKAADAWLEVAQLARQDQERQRLAEDQRAREAAFEQQVKDEREKLLQQHDREQRSAILGQEELEAQRRDHELRRAELQAQFEREREALAQRQLELERQRQERSDRDGLSR